MLTLKIDLSTSEKTQHENFLVGKNSEIHIDDAEIHSGCIIEDNVIIDVKGKFKLGKNSIIRSFCVIRGRNIDLGREFYMKERSEIGGGGCYEKSSSLKVGYWFHAGRDTFINITEKVEIGDQVGMRGNLYTHGGYLDPMEGFPYQLGRILIGNNVWMPQVTVHPNVKIGDNVVVAGGSIVTRDIPSGVFAKGTPAKVVEIRYPSKKNIEKVLPLIKNYDLKIIDNIIEVEGAEFDLEEKKVTGKVSPRTERVRDILRRFGVRFKVDIDNGFYEEWHD
jgi:acetyltransferase-like isoleucine patch superfamily enzyme